VSDTAFFTAIESLEWTDMTCPLMPHQYVRKDKASDPKAYSDLVQRLNADNPETFRAFFRGYPSNRYWLAPDGRLYWTSGVELDRCWPVTLEALRCSDKGAKIAEQWDGPRWAPNGVGLYTPWGRRGGKDMWWPTQAALDNGYRPCAACSNVPKALKEARKAGHA
jgi:hypothetical protein